MARGGFEAEVVVHVHQHSPVQCPLVQHRPAQSPLLHQHLLPPHDHYVRFHHCASHQALPSCLQERVRGLASELEPELGRVLAR
eukprot:736829-Pleurochrysis_carterae.AAC.1